MCIFTKYGFFSEVCSREGDGKYGHSLHEVWAVMHRLQE